MKEKLLDKGSYMSTFYHQGFKNKSVMDIFIYSFKNFLGTKNMICYNLHFAKSMLVVFEFAVDYSSEFILTTATNFLIHHQIHSSSITCLNSHSYFYYMNPVTFS
jgi:hypothetical protein